MEVIKQKIKSVLPRASEDLLNSIVQNLNEIGATTEEDLVYVRESDLSSVVQPIQARKLVESWKQSKSTVVASAVVAIEPANASTSQTVEASTCLPDQSLSFDWVQNFQIPWEKIPQHIMKVLKAKERPDPSNRKVFINILSSHIFNFCQKPGKANLKVIARKIVKAYPMAFSDVFCGEKLAGGYESLTRSLVIKFENLNRRSIFGGVKRQLNTSQDIDDPQHRSLRNSDQYGCINWQPEILPGEETRDTQKEKKKEMVQLSSLVPPCDIGEASLKLLEITYYSQREDINILTDVNTLLKSWPLMFTQEGFLQHFKLLVGIDIAKTFECCMKTKVVKIESFFKQNLKGKMKETIKNYSAGSLELVVRLLMDYFNEKQDSIFFKVDSSSTVNDVENMSMLPTTPCLVICDNEHSQIAYMLAIDRNIVNENLESFNVGLEMLFAAFFVLNIEYPEDASSTLELIQRCFLGINPDKGSKVSKKKKKTNVWDTKVLTLFNKLAHFEWCSDSISVPSK